MQAKVILNFTVPESSNVEYNLACKILGTTKSAICRSALDQAVLLAKKLQTPAPSNPPSHPSTTKIPQKSPQKTHQEAPK